MSRVNAYLSNLVQTNFCTTYITVYPNKLTPRIRNSVKKIIQGRALPPDSGGSKVMVKFLNKEFNLPRVYLQEVTNKYEEGIVLWVGNVNLPADVLEVVKKYQVAELMSLRLENSQSYKLSRGFLVDKLEPNEVQNFYYCFTKINCFQHLRTVLDEYLRKTFSSEIDEALKFLDSDDTISIEITLED